VLVFFRDPDPRALEVPSCSPETNRLRPIPLPRAPGGIITDPQWKGPGGERQPGTTVSLLPTNGRKTSLRAHAAAGIGSIVKLDSLAIERVLVRYRRAPYLPVQACLPSVTFGVVSAARGAAADSPRPADSGGSPSGITPDSSLVAHLVGYVGELTEGGGRAQACAFATGAARGVLLGKGGLERQLRRQRCAVRTACGFVEVSAFNTASSREAGRGPPRLPPVPGPARALHNHHRTSSCSAISRKIFSGGTNAGAVLRAESLIRVRSSPLYSAPRPFDPKTPSWGGRWTPDYWRRLNVNEAHPPVRPNHPRPRYQLHPGPPGSFRPWPGDWRLKRGLVNAAIAYAHSPCPRRVAVRQPLSFPFAGRQKGHGRPPRPLADRHRPRSCERVLSISWGLKLGLTSLLEGRYWFGFPTRATGIDLPGEITSEFPGGTELLRPRVRARAAWDVGGDASTPGHRARRKCPRPS